MNAENSFSVSIRRISKPLRFGQKHSLQRWDDMSGNCNDVSIMAFAVQLRENEKVPTTMEKNAWNVMTMMCHVARHCGVITEHHSSEHRRSKLYRKIVIESRNDTNVVLLWHCQTRKDMLYYICISLPTCFLFDVAISLLIQFISSCAEMSWSTRPFSKELALR